MLKGNCTTKIPARINNAGDAGDVSTVTATPPLSQCTPADRARRIAAARLIVRYLLENKHEHEEGASGRGCGMAAIPRVTSPIAPGAGVFTGQQEQNRALQAARDAARRFPDAAIVPVRYKAPILPGWQDLPPDIHGTPEQWAMATGAGLVLGDRLAAIDLDDPTFKAELLPAVPALARTYTQATGKPGGEHIVFRPASALKKGSINGPNGERAGLRPAGHIIVLAGSDHYDQDRPTGKRYTVKTDAPPVSLTIDDTARLAEIFYTPPVRSTHVSNTARVNLISNDPAERERDARIALTKLAPWRCDNYREWVAVGMALTSLGGAGLDLWDSWSQGSEKYPGRAGIEKKWATFKSGAA